MSQPISIRTTAGIRLDVYATETIEVNMGGVSLLSLDARTQTYTNTFKLPRTPVNEQAFQYASQPTRNNKPILDVVISKGLFSSSAKLTVESFDKDYSCTIKYTGVLDTLSAVTYESIYHNRTILSGSTDQDLVRSLSNITLGDGFGTYKFAFLHTNGSAIPIATNLTKSLFVPLSDLLQKIATANSITIDGTLFSDADFSKSYYCLTNGYIVRTGTVGNYTYTSNVTDSGLLATEIIKEVAMLFFCDVVFSSAGITLNKIVLTATAIPIEGATFSKAMRSGLSESNFVVYDLCKSIADKHYGSDMITSDGIGSKDLVKLNTYIPAADSVWNPSGGIYGLRILGTDADATNKIIIGFAEVFPTDTSILYNGVYYDNVYGVDDDVFVYIPFSISGYYSTTLDPILTSSVILDAETWLSPTDANLIMTSRIISSVQMGGKYWVDEMKYNLTTGKAVLKLIKI